MKVERKLPANMFLDGARASTLKTNYKVILKQKNSPLPKLAEFALTNCKKPRLSHEAVEEFFFSK